MAVQSPVIAQHVVPPQPHRMPSLIASPSAGAGIRLGILSQSPASSRAAAAAYGITQKSNEKQALLSALEGINRGIFGVPSSKKTEIDNLVALLESQTPFPDPTSTLEKVAGDWRLIYSTITILGSKRTKLGLRDFITLGDFFQSIDITQRVDISFTKAEITPPQLMNVFRKNYDLLLDIFNPEGWLELTYVDESLRIGRDDKENMFILERTVAE